MREQRRGHSNYDAGRGGENLELAVAILVLQGHEETTAKMETVAKTMAGSRSLRKEKDMAKLTQQTAAQEPEEALAEVKMKTTVGWLTWSLWQWEVDLCSLGYP